MAHHHARLAFEKAAPPRTGETWFASPPSLSWRRLLPRRLRVGRGFGISALLAGTNFALLLVAGMVGWLLSARYEDLLYAFEQRQAQALVRAISEEALWDRHAELVAELASRAAQDKRLAAALAASDRAAITAVLADQFRQGLVTLGTVRLLGLGLYDTEMTLLARHWAGDDEGASPPRELLGAVGAREGTARLETFVDGWASGGTPYFSVFVPIGGLRPQGYVSAHVDPLWALRKMDERLGMQVIFTAVRTGRVLAELANVEIAPTALVKSFLATITTPAGIPLAATRLDKDVTALAGMMVRARHKYFLIFALLALTTAAISVMAVNAALRHARQDELTGLCNRALFLDRVRQAVARARREAGTVAVLCLDLDRFKEVNDTLGHPIGDLLLKTVAERLLANLREIDTAARLGGDEFAVVLAGLEEPNGADTLARRLLAALAEPYDVDGHEIVVGASIGIAIWPIDGDAPEYLLKCADLALYRAKADGRGSFHFFEKGMDARLQARRALEQDLRRALAEGAFEIHYQPFIDLGSEEPTGFEALLRWSHSERGQVSPAEFIPLAEETGLIVPLGEWVLRRACAEAAAWPAPLKVAVNLSPAQFKHPEFIRVMLSALQDSGLDPGRLELEITESVLMQDTEATLATLRQLREFGVRISMDDFGTGYSSLSYLQSFSFDKIKIDQSFVRSLERNPDSAAIVRAVIHLGRSLGMATTAEGVETRNQLAYLQREGCQEVQGFYFSPAVPVAEVAALLQPGAVAASGRPPAADATPSIAGRTKDAAAGVDAGHDHAGPAHDGGGAGSSGPCHPPGPRTVSKPCEA